VIEPYDETKKFKTQKDSFYFLLNFVAHRRKEEPLMFTNVPKNSGINVLLITNPSHLTLCVFISIVVVPPALACKKTNWR